MISIQIQNPFLTAPQIKSVISVPIKDFIHHYPRALFNDIPRVGKHFYDIPRSGRSLTTYPGRVISIHIHIKIIISRVAWGKTHPGVKRPPPLFQYVTHISITCGYKQCQGTTAASLLLYTGGKTHVSKPNMILSVFDIFVIIIKKYIFVVSFLINFWASNTIYPFKNCVSH